MFRRADVLTVHVVLNERTRGLVGATELNLMKPTAVLINTPRGPIVDEPIEALRAHRLAGAGLDVFDIDPPPVGHPLRSFDTGLATPHIGYLADQAYRVFYGQSAANVARRLDQRDEVPV